MSKGVSIREEDRISTKKRSIFRSVCVVDSAITDLSSIMKRFIQTGDVPNTNNMIEVYQYGNEDELIDKKRVESGEDPNSVAKTPTDSFANLSDEELELIPDAPLPYLEIDEYGDYVENSATADKKARDYYRAKEKERQGQSIMSKQIATANAIKTAESMGYTKKSESSKSD